MGDVGEVAGLAREVLEKFPDSDPARAERRERERTIKEWWRASMRAVRAKVLAVRLRWIGNVEAESERLKDLGVDVADLQKKFDDAVDDGVLGR